MTPHWSTGLIGIPYVDGGESLDGFNCWGLVRWAFIHVFGIDMPRISIGNGSPEERDSAIRQVETASGWRRVHGKTNPQDRDILLMWGPHGRHVALAVWVNGGIYALHSIEGMGVTLTPYNELWFMAFHSITIWRKA